MFDAVLLRSLVAVIDMGGFTRAAERLHLTQSAVSAHIRRLEMETGHKLLERTTRSVALTPAGARLAGYARTILALNEDARASLRAGRRFVGTVSIGLSEEMAKTAIIDCLRRFSVAHRQAGVSVKIALTGELFAHMQAGDLDIVLGSQCAENERGDVLWSEPLVWASAGPLTYTDDTSEPLPLAVYPESCPYRAAAIETLARSGRKWRIACQSPSAAGLTALVAGGLGVAPITRSAAVAAGLYEMNSLPRLPDALFLLVAKPKLTATAAALLSALRECASRHAG